MLPQARIHADARALPGNSGGAVLNAAGELVGILAAGDGKISEIIPIQHLSALLSAHLPLSASSVSDHSQSSARKDQALR